MLGPAVHTRRSRPIVAATQIEPKLGGDHHFPADRSEGFADQLFVQEGAVNFGRVKESDAAIHRSLEQFRHLLFVFGWAVGEAHSHAAKTDGRDFQIAVSEFPFLHC